MNKFTELESEAAQLLYKQTLEEARQLCACYSTAVDHDAATIAALLLALELAGGKHFIKPQEE
jgi:hypothetical protein